MEEEKRKLVKEFLLDNLGHYDNKMVDKFIKMIELIANKPS